MEPKPESFGHKKDARFFVACCTVFSLFECRHQKLDGLFTALDATSYTLPAGYVLIGSMRPSCHVASIIFPVL
jgi:hypothetical protein